MKKLARGNDSVIKNQVWDLQFEQICVPILCIILGIIKDMSDAMVEEVKAIDNNSCPKRIELEYTCDMLHYYVIEWKEWKDWKKKLESRWTGIELEYNNAKNNYTEAMLKISMRAIVN